MMQKNILILAVVIIILALAVIFWPGSPAGQLIRPDGCYYRTITGDFIVDNVTTTPTDTCNFQISNYDPFTYGYITNGFFHADKCLTSQRLEEWSCVDDEKIDEVLMLVGEDQWTCALDCQPGEGNGNVYRADPPTSVIADNECKFIGKLKLMGGYPAEFRMKACVGSGGKCLGAAGLCGMKVCENNSTNSSECQSYTEDIVGGTNTITPWRDSTSVIDPVLRYYDLYICDNQATGECIADWMEIRIGASNPSSGYCDNGVCEPVVTDTFMEGSPVAAYVYGNSHVITVTNVISSTDAVISVDGQTEIISESGSYTINGVPIRAIEITDFINKRETTGTCTLGCQDDACVATKTIRECQVIEREIESNSNMV